jgi:putative spermidine/putrescine transport system substrate-binding protein
MKEMNKFITLILCIVVVFASTACGQATASPAATVTNPAVMETTAIPEITQTTIAAATATGITEMPTIARYDFKGKTITLGVWGGYSGDSIKTAFVDPFELATGATVNVEEYGADATAKVKADVQAGIHDYDLVSGWGALDMVAVARDAGALQPIDYSRVPNSGDLMEQAKFEYAIGQYVCSTHFTYNPKYFPNGGPDDAAKFYDVTDYPGPRALVGFSPTGMLEQALIADGVAVKDLYPLDVDRAFRELDKVKPSIAKWWNSGAEIFQTSMDEEAVAGDYWIAHAYRAQDAGANIVISFKDASLLADAWAIPVNAQNLDVVYAFLNYTIDGKRAANYTRIMGYAPLVKDAYQYLTPEESMKLATYPANEAQGFWVNVPYWEANFAKLTERYLEWQSK